MAEEIGQVARIEDSRMDTKIPTGKGCGFCPAKSACSFRGPESAYRHIEIPWQPGIQEGDHVTLEIRESAQNIATLIVFILPISSIVGSYLLASYVFRIPNSEILGVSAGFLLYGVALYLSNRWLSRSSMFLPRIIDVDKKSS